jgi:large subunit ribosomal protein L17
MVTLAKRDTLHARRQVLTMVPDPAVVKKLFDSIAARFGDRHGGYTRIIKAGTRPGDRAPVVILELVDRPEVPKEKGKKDAKAERASRGDSAGAGAARGRKKKAAAAAS